MIRGKSTSWQECPGSRLESNDRTLPLLPPPQAVAPSIESPRKSRREAFLGRLYSHPISRGRPLVFRLTEEELTEP